MWGCQAVADTAVAGIGPFQYAEGGPTPGRLAAQWLMLAQAGRSPGCRWESTDAEWTSAFGEWCASARAASGVAA